LHSLAFEAPDDGFWPDQEIWLFHARSNLRIVEIHGVASIDPLQTSVPQKWQKFPAYRMVSGDTMEFQEIKRGDPQPAPDQLTIERFQQVLLKNHYTAIIRHSKGQDISAACGQLRAKQRQARQGVTVSL